MRVMPATCTIDTFAPRIGEVFRIVVDEARALETVLVEVTPWGKPGTTNGSRQPFSLIFRAASEVVLPQRIYGIENAGIGAVEIFLVPIGPDAGGMRYQAVFS